jgi:hypothetical protein
MHITGYLGDEPRDRVFRFIEAAVRTGYFGDVLPVRRTDGTIVAVAMLTGPDDGSNAILEACWKLSRILGRDTDLTSPWDITRLIPGRGGGVAGEVVTDRGELTG